MEQGLIRRSSRQQRRGLKRRLDPNRPYEFIVEQERAVLGQVQDVATVFLTNRECPFGCIMCDLWLNTLDERVPVGAIPNQINYALQRLGPASVIKLYNSGNWFDAQAIPPEDWPAVATQLSGFERVIVENHPRLCRTPCRVFSEMLSGQLEIALGLETVHPEILRRLNKQMTLDDFARATEMLRASNIDIRAFILLKTPWMSEQEGLDWAVKSMEFAFAKGVGCCSLIPTRGGIATMNALADKGHFTPPTLRTLEMALEAGLALNRGRVFVDLWDASQMSGCARCKPKRIKRMERMNLTQQVDSTVCCDCVD